MEKKGPGVFLNLIAKGIYCLLIGLLKWPFRYDWVRKLIIMIHSIYILPLSSEKL